jgi:hypothetical protein
VLIELDCKLVVDGILGKSTYQNEYYVIFRTM